MTEVQKREILPRILESARAASAGTGFPVSLAAAQCILESAWLSRAPGNNPFGIKRAARHAKWQTFRTREVIEGKEIATFCQFAAYESLEDAFKDYVWLITHGTPYKAAWSAFLTHANPRTLASDIAKVYATDPKYAEKVLKLMDLIEK